MQLTFFQKFWSRWFPVLVKKSSSENNSYLALYYYKRQWQLTTKDAIYSDGIRYRPLTIAFDLLKEKLKQVQTVLVLGTGLGSAVNILHQRGMSPMMTLVEKDALICQWAQELLSNTADNFQLIHADAEEYISSCQQSFDLIIIDIFISQKVPEFVISQPFLNNCKSRLGNKGVLIFNYIIQDKTHWSIASENLKSLFSEVTVQELGMNRIVVAYNH